MTLTRVHLALIVLFCVATQTANSEPDSSENVLPPIGHTYFCMRYPGDCQRAGSGPSLPTARADRFTELKLINATVNAAIIPQASSEDMEKDWILFPKNGDCVGYAVSKRHALLEAGWPSSALLLAEVTLLSTGEHHLILIVRGVNADWVLDNLNPEIVRLAETRNEYGWDRIESSTDPKFWTKSFASLG